MKPNKLASPKTVMGCAQLHGRDDKLSITDCSYSRQYALHRLGTEYHGTI
jgi:hypothetical protein